MKALQINKHISDILLNFLEHPI